MNRETITQALADRLFAIDGIRTTGRKPKAWDQVSPTDCPCLFLGVGSSHSMNPVGHFQMWRMEFLAYVYTHDGSQVGPSMELNGIIDAIDVALQRGPDDPNGMGVETQTTLGGLAHAANVESVVTDEGSFGDRAVAMVTIQVLAAG